MNRKPPPAKIGFDVSQASCGFWTYSLCEACDPLEAERRTQRIRAYLKAALAADPENQTPD